MEGILLFAYIIVLLLEKLRGLVLVNAAFVVQNDCTVLNEPKSGCYI